MEASLSKTSPNVVDVHFTDPTGNIFFGEDGVEAHGEINDSDIFKYFLNDELQTRQDLTLDSIESDSSEASPPQLTPESIQDFPTSSTTSSPISSTKIKDELPAARKRSAPLDKDGDSPVALSRDELVKLSVKGIENYSQSSPANKINTDDDRQVKRQRRLVKNRESAQLSRLRKKVYIEELERKVNQLTADNENLAKQVHSIANDKKKLQDEVVQLHQIIKQSPNMVSQLANAKRPAPPPQRNVKAAGLVLLVVLFSFGLLFNAAPGLVTSDGADVSRPKNFHSGRLLKSVKDEGNVSAPLPEVAIKAFQPTPAAFEKKDTVVEVSTISAKQVQPSAVRRMSIDRVDEPGSKKRKMKIAEEDEARYQDASDAKTGLVPHRQDGPFVVSSNAALALSAGDVSNIIARPNTDYIYCNDAQRISHNNSQSRPENIALLIPSNLFDAAQDPNFDASLLEVSCQIMNFHMWPLRNATLRT